MLRYALCLVALFAGFSPAYSQAPVPTPTPAPTPPALAITGATQIQENSLTILSLTGGKATVAWLVMPTVSQYVAGQQLVFTGAPGTYTVICLAVSNDQPVILQTAVTISPIDPPSPPPSPTPTPAPSPTPTSGPLWVIAVYDTTQQANLTPGQLGVWTSQTLAPSLKSLGTTLRRYDINNPSIASAAWKKALAGQALPVFAILNSSGKMILGPDPLVDEPTLIAAVKGVAK